jgi:glycine amidinotransferase
MIINSYTEFQPLQEVVIGQGYPPEYFDFIQDSQVRNSLEKIFIEIEEDFASLIKVLESFNITVKRPGIISKTNFQSNTQHGNYTLPPLTPRDRQQVYGNKLVRFSPYNIFNQLFKHYESVAPDQVIDIFKTNPNHFFSGANASCIYRMGRDVWFDESNWLTADQTKWLEENILTDSRYRFHRMVTDGHSDCVFAVLKPGVILTSIHDDGVNYRQDFPNWNIHRVMSPSIERFHEFRNELHPGSTWWVPGKDNLPQFREYVNTYLKEWVGTVHESVFDVNCLSIDENHVIFGCYDKEVFDYCRKNGVEPILCDIRHRFFFDGSVHCCSLDIRREGTMEDYFG